MQTKKADLHTVDYFEGEDCLCAVWEFFRELSICAIFLLHGWLDIHFLVAAVQHSNDDFAGFIALRVVSQELVHAVLDMPRKFALR